MIIYGDITKLDDIEAIVNASNGSGINFSCGLKLLNVINWSWWYVLSPTLIYAGLWFITAIIIFFDD